MWFKLFLQVFIHVLVFWWYDFSMFINLQLYNIKNIVQNWKFTTFVSKFKRVHLKKYWTNIAISLFALF